MKQLLRLLAIVILAGAASCGPATERTTPAVGTPLAIAKFDSIPQTVHVIPFYNYGKQGYDALGPGGNGGLIGSKTMLYGATVLGGSTKCSTKFGSGSNSGCGIVYRLVPKTGKTTYKIEVLHKFKGAPEDGAASLATLLADKSGDLYGTTYYGGKFDGGTLFKLHPTSSGYTETIVHSFGYGQDGAYPASGVIEVKGVLYGTTNGGGAYTQSFCESSGGVPNGTCGTVYGVNAATGTEQVLHSFGNGADGAVPFAGLLDVAGTLYGTTDLGGSLSLCGTVFSIRTDGSDEQVVHNFLNAPRDGCDPFASLIDVKHTLYGTTCCGGGNYCANHCEGTLFSVDLATGKEEILHKFGNGQDGSEPVAAVVNVRGVLYGTTNIGGGTSCSSGDGCGTIFSFVPSLSNPIYSQVYDFTSGNDGSNPSAALLYSDGAFYGTTVHGGKHNFGTGVKLRP